MSFDRRSRFQIPPRVPGVETTPEAVRSPSSPPSRIITSAEHGPDGGVDLVVVDFGYDDGLDNLRAELRDQERRAGESLADLAGLLRACTLARRLEIRRAARGRHSRRGWA